jgi:thioredoxin-like negative regulator of GroEL
VRLSPSADERPRLITFCGPGCAACRVQRAIVERLHAAWPGGFAFEEVDAAVSPLAGRLGIVTVPATVVAAPSGRVVAINSGLTDAGRLASQLGAAGPGRGPHHRRGTIDDRDDHARVDAA